MADNILKVNHLPVLTWFHNQLNDAEFKVKDSTEEAIRTADHPAYLVKPEFPKEIIVKEGVSPTDLLKMYEDEGASINRETYVAGKYPIYHEQPFATGMGKEIDDLIVKMGAPARVIEVPENVKIKDPVYLHYLSDLFYLLFISETSDTVLVFVSLCEFHFHTVEDDIALLGVFMRNKPGSVKLRMVMSVPSAGDVLILGNPVAVRGERSVPGRSAGISPCSIPGGAGR